jgi:hypothetical protein
LPLEYGLSLEETGRILGRTASWVSRIRRSFIQGKELHMEQARGGRRNALLDPDEELNLVKLAMIQASRSPRWLKRTIRGELRKLVQARMNSGKSSGQAFVPSESTLTRILARAAAHWLPGQSVWELSNRSHELIHHWLRPTRQVDRN